MFPLFPWIQFPILSWFDPAGFSTDIFVPMTILLDPVVIVSPAYLPIPIFWFHTVFFVSAPYPSAVLFEPAVFTQRAARPIPVFWIHVVLV